MLVEHLLEAGQHRAAYGTIFGVGTVLFIGTMLLVLGVPLMFWCAYKYPTFFSYSTDPPELVKDPNSEDTMAAPLGTYREKGASHGS